MKFPTSSLFRISVPPGEEPIEILYPSASETGSQLKSVSKETSISFCVGLLRIVHSGRVKSVSVVKDSSLHPVASPTVL